MQALLYVFVGGGLGSLCRYGLSQWLPHEGQYPLGTLAANIFACCVLGLLIKIDLQTGLEPSLRLLLATGFCGGFSTFSTINGELLQMIQKGDLATALSYLALSFGMGLISVYAGYKLGEYI